MAPTQRRGPRGAARRSRSPSSSAEHRRPRPGRTPSRSTGGRVAGQRRRARRDCPVPRPRCATRIAGRGAAPCPASTTSSSTSRVIDRRGAGAGSARALIGDPAATAGTSPPTATPRAGPSPSPTPARAPGCCSSPRARAAWASPRSPPTWPSRWPSGASRSASSTPTSGASPSPACSAIDRPPTGVMVDGMLVPPEANGVRCISMGFFAEEDQPVIWRGPMLHKALEQFLTDVWWGDPDYLVVDLPPGTGDISLSLAAVPAPGRGLRRHHPPAGGPAGGAAGRPHGREGPARGPGRHREHVLVHRRRRQALRALRRRRWPGAGRAARRAPPRPGPAGARRSARAATSAGPSSSTEPDSEAAEAFRRLAETVDTELAPTKRYHPELKITDAEPRSGSQDRRSTWVMVAAGGPRPAPDARASSRGQRARTQGLGVAEGDHRVGGRPGRSSPGRRGRRSTPQGLGDRPGSRRPRRWPPCWNGAG